MKNIFPILSLASLLAAGCGKGSSAKTNEATLVELNRDLSVVMTHSAGRLPGTNEVIALLTATGKAFPAAPAGKKIILDPDVKQFVMVDE